MKIINYEFKARVGKLKELEQKLMEINPVYKGEDNQVDTYFNVPAGRLKLREGQIENALIYYERPDISGARQSDVLLYKHNPDKSLKDILTRIHGIRVIVNKKRRIYFVENVKFHFDIIKELGTFIEVEASDKNGTVGLEKLKEQCDKYSSFFGLEQSDFIKKSYSDMLLEIKAK